MGLTIIDDDDIMPDVLSDWVKNDKTFDPPDVDGDGLADVGIVPLEAILEHPRNWRTHPPEQVAALRKSLQEFGVVQPCTFNVRTGHLLDGHLRLAIAREDQADGLYCRRVDWDGHKEERFLLACDKITLLAGQDDERLAALLALHQDDEEGLVPGWDQEQIDSLTITDAEEAEYQGLEHQAKELIPAPDADSVPSRVKMGDIWKVGPHVVMCADNTHVANIQAALETMGVERIDLMFTDPPYDIHAETLQFPDADGQKRVRDGLQKVQDAKIDKFDPNAILSNLSVWFGWCSGKPFNFAIYAFCNDALVADYMIWSRNNGGNGTILFWRKQQPMPKGGSHWQDVEYLVYIKKNGHWNNSDVAPDCDRNKCLMFDRASIEEDGDDADHPTPKPVPLITNQLLLTTKPGDVVADPYGGRGSTLIACELTGRRCIYMDHEPKFADAALSWAEMVTGFTARKIRNVMDQPGGNLEDGIPRLVASSEV